MPRESHGPWGHKELDMSDGLSLHFTFPFKAIKLTLVNLSPCVGSGGSLVISPPQSFSFEMKWLRVKSPPASAGDSGDVGSIPGSGRSPGGGNGNSLQCSRLENPMDGGAWRAAVHGATQSRTRLSTRACGWDSIVDEDVGGRRLFPLSPTSHFHAEPMT